MSNYRHDDARRWLQQLLDARQAQQQLPPGDGRTIAAGNEVEAQFHLERLGAAVPPKVPVPKPRFKERMN